MAEYRLFSRGDGGGRRRSPYMTAAALAIVLFLVVAPEVNEGSAMAPTIKDGQLLVTSKIITHYSIKRKVPRQGQLVVLDKVLSKKISDDNIIARVVAGDGDHVVVSEGRITINDKEYVAPGGIRGGEGDVDVTLEGNEVFLLCDNREELMDSRNPALGPVDMRKIKGNVLLRIWPLSRFGRVQ